MNTNRKHMVMADLLYPAFLGTLIYSTVDKINKPESPWSISAGVLVFCLLLHYVMDYLYTKLDRPAEYSWWHFGLDGAIVLCMFFAVRGALDANSMPWGLPPVAWLVMTKLAAVLWELAEPGTRTNRKRLAIGSDAAFGLGYILAWLFCSPYSFLLSIWVSLDAICYRLYDLYLEKSRRERAALVVEVRVDVGDT